MIERRRSLVSIFKSLKKTYGPQHWWPADTAFEVIVGAILTQNTSWTNVGRAIRNLKAKRLLSVKNLSGASLPALAGAIQPAGYFNVKAKRLKNFLRFLKKGYSGNLKRLFKTPLPRLREALLSVNGIGPETADSIILYAAKKPIFVVDAYTRRVFSRLGFISHTAAYQDVQGYFLKGLPRCRKLYNECHALIVEHAKKVCLKKRPKCQGCPLKRRCDYADFLVVHY